MIPSLMKFQKNKCCKQRLVSPGKHPGYSEIMRNPVGYPVVQPWKFNGHRWKSAVSSYRIQALVSKPHVPLAPCPVEIWKHPPAR